MLRLRTLYPREEVVHNPWFRYSDDLGDGLASPDVVIVGQDWLLLGECKRTFCAEAMLKLRDFYSPLCVARWPKAYIGMVQFCMNLSTKAKGIPLVSPAFVLATRPQIPQLVFWPDV